MIAHYTIILLIMSAVLYWAGSSSETASTATTLTAESTALPALSLPQADGSHKTLADYRGKLVFIHFWASWCPPCLPELPEIIALASAHPEEIVIISYSLDKSKEQMESYYQINFPNLPANYLPYWDKDGHIAREQFLSLRYPETFIIGKDGKLADKIVGAGHSWERIYQRQK